MTDADLTDRLTLPHAVRERIQSYSDIVRERHAALIESSAQMRTVQSAISDDRALLNQLENGERNADQIAQVRSKIDRRTKALAELVARVEKLGASWKAAYELSQNLEKYARVALDGAVALYDGLMPQLQNGEKATDGIERAARRTRALKADRLEVLAAPFPSEDAKKIAREQITARVEAARPDVMGVVDRGELIKFPMSRASIDQPAGAGGPMSLYAIDPVGLLAWIFPVEFQAAIEREIDTFADDAIALSVEQRIVKLAVIDSDILASEREEVAFAELAGQLPRPDCDPRAVLGLADVMPAPSRN